MRGRMRTRTWSLVAVAAATLVLGGPAIGVVLQDGTSDEQLIDRLVAIEQQLPSLPPETVDVVPDETWATFTGDFTGARVALDTVADDARDLFITAEESGGPVASAVAEVARGILVLRHGYQYLAEWETHDLTFPLDATDEDDVATGADELYGAAQTGFALVMDGRGRTLPGYAILRDAEAADADEKALFDTRYQLELDFEASTKAALARAASFPSTQVMAPVERFVSTAPGTEARARAVTVVCIDREAYEAAGVVDAEAVAALVTVPADDCPDIDNDNDVTLVER